jgi:acetyl-CoA acetyltransferase
MTPFAKPGKSADYQEMGANAARAALSDAGILYTDVEQAYAGYVYGDSTSGQATLYHLGLTGIPVVNVNNNCSTGSSALWLARQAVESGIAECVLALGFEQMRPGALVTVWDDRPSSTGKFEEVAGGRPGADPKAPDGRSALRWRGVAHMERFGTKPEPSAASRSRPASTPHATRSRSSATPSPSTR